MSLRNGLKSSIRSLLRPFWLAIWRRIEARISAIEEAWQQHMPAFLNAVSTVGAFGHELLRYRKESLAGFAALDDRDATRQAQLDALRAELDAVHTQLGAIAALRGETGELAHHQTSMEAGVAELGARIEFVRRELLFEMKYSRPGGIEQPAMPGSSLKPRVIATEKLAAARQSALRLNLGCGHLPLDCYLNVDMRALPGVDIIADAGNVPVEPGTVQEVRSAHLLEHFPQEELRRRLLPYWLSLLAPGGTFKAIVPDGEAMLAHVAAGDYPFEQFREVLFGAQDYHGDFHFNMFLPGSLQALLEEAGFVDTHVPVQGRRNGLCYEFEIHAQRP
jgi:predicted SAM-dependent methyltransferase